ncbi:ABC transporter substrate-binding protein [Aneurinibacillus tyrosinisolvens]|uniref:ABC transporter substrate-binding protein n=1 Tax=Aneurinibacillus tyrosinisolvens TaxID=1443435 RepID=UPI00063F6038|nr:ABC transporter substrate-binding protein [Aneurinibacillus tyrosinisolvens]
MKKIQWKKWYPTSVSFILLFCLLMGCSQSTTGTDATKTKDGAQATGQTSQETKSKMEKIEITVTHYPTGFYSLPYEVGIDQGFFKEESIEIAGIIPGTGGGTTVRNVLSGKLPFGDVATSAAVQSYLSGAPLVIVGGSVQTFNDAAYITRKDAPFNNIKDLVGHTWAYTNPGSTTQAASHLILEKAGIDPNQLKAVSSGGLNEGKTLLEKGGIDATVQLEPLLTIEKDKYKTLFRIGDYLPKFQQSVIIASPQLIKENPELVKRFLRVYDKSVKWIYEHQEEAGKIFAKYAEIDEKASISAVSELAKRKHWSVTIDAEAINSVLKGMKYLGTFKEGTEIPWKELLNQDFIPTQQKLDVSTLLGNK